MTECGCGVGGEVNAIDMHRLESENGVTAQHYVDQILKPHFVPFFVPHHSHVFQQDNSSFHTSRDSMKFLRQHNIRTRTWPVLSSNLNPIEHPWVEIQRRLNQVVQGQQHVWNCRQFHEVVGTSVGAFCELFMHSIIDGVW